MNFMLIHVLKLHIRPAVNRNKEWFQLISMILIISSGMEPALFAHIEALSSGGDASNLYRISARRPIILRVS